MWLVLLSDACIVKIFKMCRVLVQCVETLTKHQVKTVANEDKSRSKVDQLLSLFLINICVENCNKTIQQYSVSMS